MDIEKIIEKVKKLDAGGQKHHKECEFNVYPCLECMQANFLFQAFTDATEQARQEGREEENTEVLDWICHNNAGLMNAGYNKAMSDLRKFLQARTK